jgi:C-terminal processing protease CtpA/Prc
MKRGILAVVLALIISGCATEGRWYQELGWPFMRDEQPPSTPPTLAREQEEWKQYWAKLGTWGMDINYMTKCVNSVEGGGPAALAGIEKGDKIIEIDEVDISNFNSIQMIKVLECESGTRRTFTIMQDDGEMVVELVSSRAVK